MKISKLFSRVASVVFVTLALVSCADADLAEQNRNYQHYMAKVQNDEGTVHTEFLDGAWLLKTEGLLTHDDRKDEFNTATARNVEKGGRILLVANGKILKAAIRLYCPPPHPLFDGSWLVPLGYKVDDLDHSPAQVLATFLPDAQTSLPEAWANYHVDGKILVTDQPLRGERDKLDTVPPERVMRFSQLDADYLELAYIDPKFNLEKDRGTHTVLEMYRRMTGDELAKLLKDSYDMKECPKNDAEEAKKKADPRIAARLARLEIPRPKPPEKDTKTNQYGPFNAKPGPVSPPFQRPHGIRPPTGPRYPL